MSFWPFKGSKPEQLSAIELRDRLIHAAASGSQKKLRAVCNQYKTQVAEHVDFLCQAPEQIRTDATAIENHIQCLGAVAQCLARECGVPDLWNRLCGTPDDNPLMRWDIWYGELSQRMERLEHDDLIAEARQFISEAQGLEGNAARQQEVFLNGRLGELLFHSGHVADSIAPSQVSLTLCQRLGDVEGQRVYLSNLLEAHRYLGNTQKAIGIGEQSLRLAAENGLDCDQLRRQILLMQQGEPLCRVVVVVDGHECELDEFHPRGEGQYDFHFRRNRLSLQMTAALVHQGNQLATAGELAEALEMYHRAMDVDPHDPDPVYQSGMCLLELGAYSRAKESFDEVERLAPGWFRCRFDRWLAEALEEQTVTEDEFRLLRVLDDGGLPQQQKMSIALKAAADYPKFAPLQLALGDAYRFEGESDKAIACYRRGISLALEPDIESRLLCAAAGTLPVDSKERKELIQRAISLDGSLVANAMARFILT